MSVLPGFVLQGRLGAAAAAVAAAAVLLLLGAPVPAAAQQQQPSDKELLLAMKASFANGDVLLPSWNDSAAPCTCDPISYTCDNGGKGWQGVTCLGDNVYGM